MVMEYRGLFLSLTKLFRMSIELASCTVTSNSILVIFYVVGFLVNIVIMLSIVLNSCPSFSIYSENGDLPFVPNVGFLILPMLKLLVCPNFVLFLCYFDNRCTELLENVLN